MGARVVGRRLETGVGVQSSLLEKVPWHQVPRGRTLATKGDGEIAGEAAQVTQRIGRHVVSNDELRMELGVVFPLDYCLSTPVQ